MIMVRTPKGSFVCCTEDRLFPIVWDNKLQRWVQFRVARWALVFGTVVGVNVKIRRQKPISRDELKDFATKRVFL